MSISDVTGIPLGQENLEKWECIFQSGESKGILNRPEKVRENHSKYWKSQGISDKCYLLFFSDIQMNCVLFAKLDQFFSSTNIKNILEKNGKNYWISQEKSQSGKVELSKGSVIIL